MTDFDTFWEAYPLKQDKKMARDLWPKALKVASFEEIMAGLETYKKGKEDWRAWMQPTKFLRRERWNDEYETTEVAAPFRSVETWSEKDFEDCAEVVSRVGRETAMRSYRYTQRQLEAVEGYLQPRSLTG